MDRSKNTNYVISKRKSQKSDQCTPESPVPSQEHISTAYSEASCSASIDQLPITDKAAEACKFYPNSKASSKKIQQMIAKSRPEELNHIIETISPNVADLMMDLYGNYMCQTLFHNSSAGQRLLLLQAMKGQLVTVAFHPRGTHALQNLIAMTSLKEEEIIYREEFQGRFVEMSKDQNASHVVQRLLVTLNTRYFIVREFLGRVEELSIDKLGVCVIKKCCNDPQVMNEILASCLLLIQHPYGNYAVQSILEQWGDEVAYQFLSAISGRVLQLCLQKYASNVMEKAIKIESIRKSIVKELVACEKLLEVVNNQYGCYVLRTLSAQCDNRDKENLNAVFQLALTKVHSQKLKPLWLEITNNLSLQ